METPTNPPTVQGTRPFEEFPTFTVEGIVLERQAISVGNLAAVLMEKGLDSNLAYNTIALCRNTGRIVIDEFTAKVSFYNNCRLN